MPDIAFLLSDASLARHDNHLRLPRAFRNAGWSVTELSQDAVGLTPAGVMLGDAAAEGFDLIWLLGMGRADTFFDRMQLLHMVSPRRFVVCVDALMYWHAKYAWWRHMPETYASCDAGYLKGLLAQGGDWVLKPAAGSFGRDVARITADDAGYAAIDRLTGEESPRYCLLQRYLPEIEQGEKRTLVAGGRIIGSYLRQPAAGATGEFRSNLSLGATATATELNAAEHALVLTLANDLAARGVGFAAVDTAYPYLMEVNLANPGGLATLHQLSGTDPAPAAVSAIAQWRGAAE